MRLPFDWKGEVIVNNIILDNSHVIPSNLNISNGVSITLNPTEIVVKTAKNDNTNTIREDEEYVFTIKSYMTKNATPEFDFMAKWNDDIPMPLRVMTGKIVKETKGMYFLKLHGDINSQITPICMKCGKPITNRISQYFGLGPVCGNHNYVNPFDTEEDLKKEVKKYRKKLQEITWSGWIPKSAIISKELKNSV